MRMDYGTTRFGDNRNKKRYIRHDYGEEVKEFKGKRSVSKPVFDRVYKKYFKLGKAGVGYRLFG